MKMLLKFDLLIKGLLNLKVNFQKVVTFKGLVILADFEVVHSKNNMTC